MSDQARALCIYAVIIAAILGPAILMALIIRYLTGWTRRVAVAALLVGLLVAPCALMASELYKADHSASPDAGGFILIGILMLMAVVLISAGIGFVVGRFLLHRHGQAQHRVFWWLDGA